VEIEKKIKRKKDRSKMNEGDINWSFLMTMLREVRCIRDLRRVGISWRSGFICATKHASQATSVLPSSNSLSFIVEDKNGFQDEVIQW
jgi:hypothetical protein